MTRLSSRRLDFTSSSWSDEELVALLERRVLLERERVDRSHQPEVALELAGAPGERRALGNRRRGRVERDRGLDVVLGAKRLDRALEPQPGLRRVDLGPLHALPRLDELLLESAALDPQLVELLGRRPRRLGLTAPAPVAEPVVQLARPRRGARRSALGQARVGGVALEQVEPVPFGSRLRLGVARRQPQLDVARGAGP